MKKYLPLLALMFIFSNCMSTKYQIDKGVVQDSTTIQFTDKALSLTPGESFSLNSLHLEANNYNHYRYGFFLLVSLPAGGIIGGLVSIPVYYICNATTPIKPHTNWRDLYKNPKVTSYKITMKDANNKTFYGRIAFFNAMKFAKTRPVCSEYRIAIPQEKFEKAKGNVSCIFESYRKGAHVSIYPTWVVWLSDKDVF